MQKHVYSKITIYQRKSKNYNVQFICGKDNHIEMNRTDDDKKTRKELTDTISLKTWCENINEKY